MPAQEATPSEKAADRMHADLSAMRDTARRYAGLAEGHIEFAYWKALSERVDEALRASTLCMSERDRKLAQRG